jgi:hypothetical protein
VELAKLQDRFRYHIDLAPADIREVATKRVLAKREEAVPLLQQRYAAMQGQLNTACHLHDTSRQSQVRENDFVQFYPYLPHFVDLSIDIMSGIRLQPGAPRHMGGSNRTIIKQAQQMLIAPRTQVAERPVGVLVRLDLIYELVEGNLSSERQEDISDITQRWLNDGGWAARVAKVICLLEFVRDLPRTEANIAALLVDEMGKPAPMPEVKAALERLESAQFVRLTSEGYKLQTAQEKRWDNERKSLDPKPKDRNDIKRELLEEIFKDPKFKTYRYRDLRTFGVGLTVDGTRIFDGQVPLALSVAEDESEFKQHVEEARGESRSKNHQDEIFWVLVLHAVIHDLTRQLYASRQMISKYSQQGTQGRLIGEYSAPLENEKHEVARLHDRLREQMVEALSSGQGIFRGVVKDASDLGRTLPEMLKQFFDYAVPYLYPKLEMGARPLKGNEAEEVLKAANLKLIRQARLALQDEWPLLAADTTLAPLAEQAQELQTLLTGGILYEQLPRVGMLTKALSGAYRRTYEQEHQARQEEYLQGIDEIKGQPMWPNIPTHMRPDILLPLTQRSCEHLDVPEDSIVCLHCKASLSQIKEHRQMQQAFKQEALRGLYDAEASLNPAANRPIKRVQATIFFREI